MARGPWNFGAVTYPRIAAAARVSLRQARRHSQEGWYDPRDLVSVATYIEERRRQAEAREKIDRILGRRR